MIKRIAGIFVLATMLWSVLAVCAGAQQVASLSALANGKGTMVANGQDKYKLTGVLVVLKDNGDLQITLYSLIQITGQGKWSTTKDPKIINFKMSGGFEGDDSNIKGKLTLSEDGKSIASLTARGKGVSGAKYEINFVAEEKKPTKP